MSTTIPKWKVSGDWFDVCSCSIPCPCTFAQAPTNGECEGVLAYHINDGSYGETSLDCLNVLGWIQRQYLVRQCQGKWWILF